MTDPSETPKPGGLRGQPDPTQTGAPGGLRGRGTALKVGVIKPDFGSHGGFERLVDQLIGGLSKRGYDIELVGYDAKTRRDDVYGYPVASVFREWHDEYFQFLCHAEQTHQLDLDAYDLVVATQPPTYLAKHARVLGLFYHQARVFYDASELFVEAGFVDADVHQAAESEVRSIDAGPAKTVKHWLAGSDVVANRLKKFWSVPDSKISPYRHPPICNAPDPAPALPPESSDVVPNIVCVNRLEFPKRSELVVAAMHLLEGVHGYIIGGGSRIVSHESIDAQLTAEGPDALGAATELWLDRGPMTEGFVSFDGLPSGRVTFTGAISDFERDRHYREASVVVAPAWNEDYGLTALEAFAWGRPLVVCNDGGGLTEIVTHGVNGLIAEPTPEGIAQAVRQILDDRRLGEELVAGGLASLANYTLENALDQFEFGIEAVMAEPLAQQLPSEAGRSLLADANSLDFYMTEGSSHVEGWLGREAMQMIHELSAQQRLDGLSGAVAEIGVHHGQLFILLALQTAPGELAVGFDLFENQDQNLDRSGEGDRDILEKNLTSSQVDRDRVRLVTANSLDLTAVDVRNYCNSEVRMFSVDGGHTAELTANDLALAAEVLAPGGIVVLDDYFNEMWPGVSEGALQFMADNPGKLIPFGVGSNKVCFTNSQDHVERYKACITAAGHGHLMVENFLAGYPVTILTEL